jgi:DNA mismatch repair protein MutL
MTRIRILPEILSNKIAAGEVVERPASVVKELVENALDARASRIAVEVRQGGKSLIQVSDNGHGMGHDDAMLAIERYATSKISTDTDLFAIRTLGFRGEALPSIAAVSRFSMVTRDSASDAGIKIDVAGGKMINVTEVGAPVGTLISVRQLFFNTPARRKFLKTVGTEMGHIADTVSAVAMGRPAVRFRLLHNGRQVKDWATADPIERAADVLGRRLRPHLAPIEHAGEGIRISGWVGAPDAHRATSRGIFLYVNGRFVKDRTVQHALAAAYRGRLLKGQFPVAVLSIEVPPGQVDVNVHPTKHQVRFVQQRRVHDAIQQAVAEALAAEDRAARRPAPVASAGDSRTPLSRTLDTPAPVPGRLPFPAARRTGSGMPPASPGPWRPPPEDPPPGPYPEPEDLPDEVREAQNTAPATPDPQGFFETMRIIGQFHNTYILCEAGRELILIDQHAAHERILYQTLKARSEQRQMASQQLLVPETVELSHREAHRLEQMLPELGSFGLALEPFGGSTFVVKAVPAPLAGREVGPLIREMVEKAVAEGASLGFANVVDQCLELMACHGAIRAGQPLNDTQIRHLLREMDAVPESSYCPHGRPTWIRWPVAKLEKAFGRSI